MIINGLLTLLYTVLSVLLSPINIPSMPDSVKEFISKALEFMLSGLNIIGNYLDLKYILFLFGLVVTIDAALLIYKIVMYVVRKIPMLNIH